MINAETAYFIYTHILPDALDLLPRRMDTLEGRAMVMAIGCQESEFNARVQGGGGPAHGFWQFERGGGIKGVLTHAGTGPLVRPILHLLRYKDTVDECYAAVTYDAVLAAVFARLLLWSVPGALPRIHEDEKGWQQYLAGWNPGKPHPEKWSLNFDFGWALVNRE